MIRIVLAACIASLATAALAQRPSTLAMSCAEAAGLIAAQGAIVLSTGVHTYDRFVAHRGFCLHNEQTERAWAPTAEGRCQIGYVCRSRQRLLRDE